jgi:hypothetical protein
MQRFVIYLALNNRGTLSKGYEELIDRGFLVNSSNLLTLMRSVSMIS